MWLRRPGQPIRQELETLGQGRGPEITHLIQRYLDAGELEVERLGRGLAWLDTGTHDSMVQASEFVRAIEARQGLKIGCVEEVAYRMGYIEAARLRELAAAWPNSPYYRYLGDLADDPEGRRVRVPDKRSRPIRRARLRPRPAC